VSGKFERMEKQISLLNAIIGIIYLIKQVDTTKSDEFNK
jgi:hypothetical protein